MEYQAAKRECKGLFEFERKKLEMQERNRRELLINQRFWGMLRKEISGPCTSISEDEWVTYFSNLFCLLEDSSVGLCEGPSIGDAILEQETTLDEVFESHKECESGQKWRGKWCSN